MQLVGNFKDSLLTVEGPNQLTHDDIDGSGDSFGSLLGATGYRAPVLLDLSRTTYIDSAGISWLLNYNKRFREAGGKLIIHSVAPMVMQVIRLMRLDTILHIAADARVARIAAEGVRA